MKSNDGINAMVSIIIPCYNNRNYLEQLVKSLIRQTYDNIEVIMVDDGSTDGSNEEMERLSVELKKRRYKTEIYWQPNGGPANAYETGLQHCKGEYIFQIDCDDTITPNAIRTMVTYLDEHKDKAVVRANGYQHFADNNREDVLFTDLPNIDINIQHRERLCDEILNGEAYLAPPCSYMYRLSAILECYPDRCIDHSRIGQNYQILVPLAYHFKMGYIDEPLFYYTMRNDSLEHSYRDPKSELWNIDESASLIYRVLKNAGADEVYAVKWSILRRDRLRLSYAYKYMNKDMANESYKSLKKYMLTDKSSMIDYLSTKYIVVRYMRKLRIVVKARILKLRHEVS